MTVSNTDSTNEVADVLKSLREDAIHITVGTVNGHPTYMVSVGTDIIARVLKVLIDVDATIVFDDRARNYASHAGHVEMLKRNNFNVQYEKVA